MAETKEVIIPVKTKGVKEADKELQELTKTQKDQTTATEEGTEATEEQGETLVDVAKDAKFFGLSINSISAGLRGTIKALKGSVVGLKAFKIALIATGIGAIVVVLGSLVAFLLSTQKGVDKVNKVLNVIKFTFDAVIKSVGDFGEGLFQIFSGDVIGGFNLLKDTIADVGDSIQRNIALSEEFSDLQIKIQEGEATTVVQVAQFNKLIAERREILADTDKDAAARVKAGEEALFFANSLATVQGNLIKLRIRDLEIGIEASETFREDEKEIAELRAQLILNDAQASRTRLRIITQLNTARKSAATEEIEQQEFVALQFFSLEKKKTAFLFEQGKVRQEVSTETAEIEQESAKETGNTLGQIGSALGQFGKAGALASAFAQLGVAIARVFGQTGVFGFAAIGPVIGAVAGAISSIKAAVVPKAPTFAHGGFIGGNTHAQGGTLIEAERGEYMINRRAMQNKGISDIAQALNNYGQSKGFKFQEGGFIGSRGQISFAEMNNLLSRIDRSVLVTEDLNRVQNRVRVTEERATL